MNSIDPILPYLKKKNQSSTQKSQKELEFQNDLFTFLKSESMHSKPAL